jgi:hypothetical protein
MLSKISKSLHEGKFSGDVYLSLDGIQINEDELILTIQATYEDEDEKLHVWKVTCTDFRDHKLNINYFEEFEVLDNHVFLWEYNNNSADLFFKGHCKDIESATLNWTKKLRSSRLTAKSGHTAYYHKRSVLATLLGEAGMLACLASQMSSPSGFLAGKACP